MAWGRSGVRVPLGPPSQMDKLPGFVYIIRSLRNNSYYVGSTNNVERRLSEHNTKRSKYTSELIPWELVFSQKFRDLALARTVEYSLKRLKNRKILDVIVTRGKVFLTEKGKINW